MIVELVGDGRRPAVQEDQVVFDEVVDECSDFLALATAARLGGRRGLCRCLCGARGGRGCDDGGGRWGLLDSFDQIFVQLEQETRDVNEQSFVENAGTKGGRGLLAAVLEKANERVVHVELVEQDIVVDGGGVDVGGGG